MNDFFTLNERLQALLDCAAVEIVTHDGVHYCGRIISLASLQPFEPPAVRLESAEGVRHTLAYSEISTINKSQTV